MIRNLFICLVIAIGEVSAQDYVFESSVNSAPILGNKIYLEPRISRASYSTNDTTQTGYLYGINLGYDVFIYNAPYLGFEFDYISGTIKGDSLSSQYTDYSFEGRAGITLGTPCFYQLTPFLGTGYEKEKNDYKTTPIEKIDYYYISTGIFSQAWISPQLSIGFDLELKFPFHGNHKIKNDSCKINSSICHKMQYFLNVPVTYWASSQLSLSAVPFYQHKHYDNNCVGDAWKSNAKMSQWGLGLRVAYFF